MDLTKDEKYRYSRHLNLKEIGETGQLKLKEAKVLVIGAGGLGCPILMYLTAAGIGTIGIVDFDTIDSSNLQRQILYKTNDVGKSKSHIAKKILSENNPYVNINVHEMTISNNNALSLIELYDIVVDGTDNFTTRYMINDACVLLGKPLVYGAIHKFEGQVSVFNYNGGATYRCVFPNAPKSGSIPSCSEAGVIGVLPGIIGSLQANEVIKIILSKEGVLNNRLLVFDAMQTSFMELNVNRKTNLADIGIVTRKDFEQYSYESFCGVPVQSANLITKELLERLPETTIVLDVREEWEEPKVMNKVVVNAPLDDIDDYVNDIPNDKPVYVVCQKGGRSKSAIDYLIKEYNYSNLINVEGGMIG